METAEAQTMNAQEARLSLHLPAGAGFHQVHEIGRHLASLGGVLRAQINPKRPRIVIVHYDPETINGERILGAVTAAGVEARVEAVELHSGASTTVSGSVSAVLENGS
jgi:hypothetical protein